MPAALYTDELADAICERLANGESLVQICKDENMPGLRTVMRWAAENSEFGTEYAHARDAQAEVMDDKILSVAGDAKSDPQAARVMVDAYKWRAAKLSPKRYGDKLDLTSGGEKLAPDETAMAVRLASLTTTLRDRADEPSD